MFTITLSIISYNVRSSPSSLIDYKVVYNSALELNNNQTLSDEPYFYLYYNNIFPTYFLKNYIGILKLFHIQDIHFFIILLGILSTIITICSCIYLIYDKYKDYSNVFLLVIMFLCFLPIWPISQTVYTDQISLFIAPLTLALLKASNYYNKNKKIIFLILSALILAFGRMIKITTLIPMIASILVYLLQSNYNPKHKKNILIFYISFILFLSIFQLSIASTNLAKKSKKTSDPIITWIALGLKDNGGFIKNSDFIANVHNLPNKQEKTKYVRNYISKNKNNFLNIDHLIKKLQFNFANGYFGLYDYVYQYTNPYKKNIIQELFSHNGKYYNYTYYYAFCFIFGIYFIYLSGYIITIVNIIKNQKISKLTLIIDISFLGYFIFLMIFEANNRQLYNFTPMLLIGSILHINQIVDFIKNKI